MEQRKEELAELLSKLPGAKRSTDLKSSTPPDSSSPFSREERPA